MLELLIAVVAFGIVLAAINTVFYAALRLRNRSAEALEQSRPLQQAVTIIRRDLANIVLPGGPLSGSLQTTSITNVVGGQSSPDFFTASGFIDETSPWADVEKVSYALVQSEQHAGGMDLIRLVTRNLLPVAVADQPVQQWLLSGVQSVLFSYYDGSQWRQAWDSTTADPVTGQTNTLPQAIKVQIQLRSQDTGRPLAFAAPVELVVPITVQTASSQSQQGTGGSQ